MESISSFTALGLMSGTSLDGVDLALCSFVFNEGQWSASISASHTVQYSEQQIVELKSLESSSGRDLWHGHIRFGRFLGDCCNEFLEDKNVQPNYIASHGHTLFHEPSEGFSFQLGHGQEIANRTRILTVADFRQSDVSLGGQGAPLVPVGDKLLFNKYDACLNIGGFANVSFTKNDAVEAFDICPANYLLNGLAYRIGLKYDEGGDIARSGRLYPDLLEKLDNLPFYKERKFASLAREHVEEYCWPLLADGKIDLEDKLHTVTVHVARQISRKLNGAKNCLVTGGGAYNSFLMELLQSHSKTNIAIPEKEIIDYKEALIFAFLGGLRLNSIDNVYSSVTGASSDSCSGTVFPPA